MKILFFVHEGALSGANAALADFMGLLSGMGYELYLITPRLGELTQRVAPYTKEVFEIYYYGWTVSPDRKSLKKNQLRHRLRNLYAVHQIGKVIKKIQPDYCVTNTITIDVGALAAKKKGVKHIWFVHEFGESDHGFSFACGMDKARKRMLNLSYKVAVNSLAVLKTFPASVKLKVLYNYVTTPQIEIAPLQKSDQMRFLLLGQIATSKNQSEAIRALAEARKRGYDFHLSVFGRVVNEDYYRELLHLVKELGMERFVSFGGYSNDVFSLFGIHHALIMCSRNEAFGRVTLESLLAGRPVIGADSGGTSEMITNGQNGLLYRAGDAGDLCQKMIDLSNEYTLFDCKAISEAARKKFNRENTLSQLKEIFK